MAVGNKRKNVTVELKKQIYNLSVMGYTAESISKEVGLSERTVYRYIKIHRIKRAKEQFKHAEEIIGDLILSQERRIKHLHTIIHSGTKLEKLKAMSLLQHEDDMKIKRNQLAGNLPSEAPTVAIQNNTNIQVNSIADSIRKIHPDLINKFTNNKARIKEDGNE